MNAQDLAEFTCLSAIRDGNVQFYRAVLAEAQEHRRTNPLNGSPDLTPEEVAQLRLESVEQMAEFLYMMELTGLNHDPVGLRRHLERHNADLQRSIDVLRAQKRGYTAGGLSVSRLEKGILDRNQINALVDEADDQGLRYDQSSLGCLLIEAMALESSRTLIILLHNCGFLKRRGAGSKSIRSTGKLETAFRAQLRHLIDCLAAVRSEAAS